jgi:hypothetical protein
VLDKDNTNCFDIPIVGQGRQLVVWPIEDKKDVPPYLAEVNDTAMGWTCTESNEDGEFLHIIFHLTNDPAEQAGIIAHECLHAVNLIHRSTGQKYNIKKNDDEFACYIIQWLVERCHDSLLTEEE